MKASLVATQAIERLARLYRAKRPTIPSRRQWHILDAAYALD